MVTALVTIAALGPFDLAEKETEAGQHSGEIHQFTLSGFESASFSAAWGSSSNFDVSSNGAVLRKEDVTLEGGARYAVVVQAEDDGFLGVMPLTLSVSVRRTDARAELSDARYRAAVAGGYEGAVLTLSAADERVSLSYSGGLEDSSFALVSLSSGDLALSLGAVVSGPSVAVLEPILVFREAGLSSVTATADVKVTLLGPYSDSAVIQHNATSVAYHFSIPGFAGARFQEVGEGGDFYSVLENGKISLTSSMALTASVSHTIVVRGEDDGFLGDALFTLALSVSFCKADMERATEDDAATLNSQLIQAAKDGDAGLVCELLQQGADVSVQGGADSRYYLRTPLQWAAKHGHLDVVKYLLSRDDVDVNAFAGRGNTPFEEAVFGNHLDVVKYLLSRDDVDVNVLEGGYTVLHRAALFGFLDAVKLLLSRDDVDANVRNDSFTPLHFALINSQLDVVKYLLSRDDVDANAAGYAGDTPLHMAVKSDDDSFYAFSRDPLEGLEIVKYLLSRDDVDANLRMTMAGRRFTRR